MNNFKRLYKMTCEEAQLLMVPMWAGTFGIANEEKQSFESHLIVCQACTKEYEETKRLMSFVKKYWEPISSETQQLLEHAGYKVVEQSHVSNHHKRPMTVEEGWKDLRRRCPDLSESTEKPKSLQLFLRISAVAACLATGVFTWLVFSNYSKPHTLLQTSSEQVVSALKPSVKVELVRPSGNIAVATDQKIIADNKLKTLLINGKHLMIMNVGSSLSIEPLVANAQIGCLVKLNAGEIHTYVEHDGNPFIVGTANGKAVITGTTFDVKATGGSTTLLVSEGTVRFESEKGTVKVAAGQTSEIVGQSAPSIPLSCNTAELTAWATGYKLGPVLAKTELNPALLDILLSFGEKPIILAKTDYKQWVEEKREWFKTNFPWIFELKDALAREGTEVDYPELLIKTGVVWQFVCLQRFPARFSVPDFEFLLKVASFYGFDKEWLFKNVPTAKVVQNKSLLLQNPTRLAAFEQWLKYATGKEEAPSSCYSADACKYLAETRSLIWFAIKGGRYDLTDGEHPKVLDLLQKEVTTACKCQNEVLYPEDEPKSSCCENKYQEPVDSVVGYIETIVSLEKEITEYEINK